jgi:hypothetical protein
VDGCRGRLPESGWEAFVHVLASIVEAEKKSGKPNLIV